MIIDDDAHRTALKAELEELKALEGSRAVNSNVAREIIQRMIRLVEIFVDGKPTTEVPPRHHA